VFLDNTKSITSPMPDDLYTLNIILISYMYL